MGDARQPRQSRWLKLVGLAEQPIDPDAWMAVAEDLSVDDVDSGSCAEAARIADALKAEGIEAEQRSYVLADRGRTSNFRWGTFAGGPSAAERVRTAVVVHKRDLERAKTLVAKLGTMPAPTPETSLADTTAADQPTPQSAGFLPTDVTDLTLPDN